MIELEDWVYYLMFITLFAAWIIAIIAYRQTGKWRHMYDVALKKLIKAEDANADLEIDRNHYRMLFDEAKTQIKILEKDSEDLKNFRDLTYCLSKLGSGTTAGGKKIDSASLTYGKSLDVKVNRLDPLEKKNTDTAFKNIQAAVVIDKRTFADIVLTHAGFMWDIWEGKTKWMPSGYDQVKLDTSDFDLLPMWKQEWERSDWRP